MSDHTTQRTQILALLREVAEAQKFFKNGGWVPLPTILNLRIANYRARISELRQQGYDVRCETEYVGKVRHSRYRLVVPRAEAVQMSFEARR